MPWLLLLFVLTIVRIKHRVEHPVSLCWVLRMFWRGGTMVTDHRVFYQAPLVDLGGEPVAWLPWVTFLHRRVSSLWYPTQLICRWVLTKSYTKLIFPVILKMAKSAWKYCNEQRRDIQTDTKSAWKYCNEQRRDIQTDTKSAWNTANEQQREVYKLIQNLHSLYISSLFIAVFSCRFCIEILLMNNKEKYTNWYNICMKILLMNNKELYKLIQNLHENTANEQQRVIQNWYKVCMKILLMNNEEIYKMIFSVLFSKWFNLQKYN